MTFVVYSDASFATRSDLSSQGGYLLAMCHRDVADVKGITTFSIGAAGNCPVSPEALCQQNLKQQVKQPIA